MVVQVIVAGSTPLRPNPPERTSGQPRVVVAVPVPAEHGVGEVAQMPKVPKTLLPYSQKRT